MRTFKTPGCRGAKGEALRTILEKLEVPYFASPFAAELDGREVVSLLDKAASRPIPFWNYLRISGIFHPPAFI
ncbi:MAG: hypothetical protein HC913_09585 [Microscillaceae bacterium]|nr:hypothetical protein [Microscillaceae bacterium]